MIDCYSKDNQLLSNYFPSLDGRGLWGGWYLKLEVVTPTLTLPRQGGGENDF